MRFKVGDKVEIIKNSSGGRHPIGYIGKITEMNGSDRMGRVGNESFSNWYYISDLKKIGGTMYDELKERIEALDNGWNREADDILQEILSSQKGEDTDCYALWLTTWNDTASRYIKIFANPYGKNEEVFKKHYETQCEKMTAFKSALLWLLDHSDIKKDDKAGLKAEIKDLRTEFKERLKELEDKL